MKKSVAAALATSVMAAVAAVAIAQTYSPPALTFDASVTPENAGTKKRPKNSRIRLSLSIAREARRTADELVFNLPRHVRVSGRGFRYCPWPELDTTEDPTRCPKGSKVGRGTATAAYGPQLFPINFDVTVFAGSRNELTFWMQSTNPPITKALRGVISRAGSPYYQRVTVDIPPELQRHMGAHVYLTRLEATVGGRTARREGRRRYSLVSSIGCPRRRRHRFETRVRFVADPNRATQGEASLRDTSGCSR